MEYLSDMGINWRLELQSKLKLLGIQSIVPEIEEQHILNQEKMNELKKTSIDMYIEIMRKLIKLDLDFVESTDMTIVKYKGERTAGTFHEVGHAFELGKPIYLITSLGLTEIPGWFLACMTRVFNSSDELIKYLEEISNE